MAESRQVEPINTLPLTEKMLSEQVLNEMTQYFIQHKKEKVGDAFWETKKRFPQ